MRVISIFLLLATKLISVFPKMVNFCFKAKKVQKRGKSIHRCCHRVTAFRSKFIITPPACLLFSRNVHRLLHRLRNLSAHFLWYTQTSSLFVQRRLSFSCMLVGRHRPALSLILLFCLSFFMWKHIQGNRQTGQTQVPAVPVIPVTFLISSELFSMPAVKRFSVSFARHPTNGMSAFIQVISTLLQFFLLSCMTFCGKTFPVFSIFGGLTFGCVNYIKRLQDKELN